MIAAAAAALVSALGVLLTTLAGALGGPTLGFLHVYPLGVAGIFICWRVVRRFLS